MHAGIHTPPGADTTPGPGRPPPDQADPPGAETPQTRPPPWKQTAAYGQRAAGTHPTGMHSCLRESLAVKGR